MGFSYLREKFRVKWDGIKKDTISTGSSFAVKQFTAV